MNIEYTNKLFDLKEFTKYSSTFIETGTSMGDGVQRAVDAGFESITSIEASEQYFFQSFKRFQNHKQVSIILGESTNILPSLLVPNKDKQFVFFLDAHPSAKDSYGYAEWVATQQNIQDEIITAELEIILANSNKHIIIIDDMRGADDFSIKYMTKIYIDNNQYNFKFYDENLTGKQLFKNKILAAVPI